ncbi:alpha-amylase family protein [Corynebacterium sanguinis]|uniref:alpha-amylase family protein n=1 Tax=Corynebacterium sanguinis TaxID=2594913 RepID=UPI00223BDCF4|nr:alpha-amylase family protein [Corynebacterium sanguinis]MCT2023896.1 alpha-amylase family protein [Corynebacterium sanguinis]
MTTENTIWWHVYPLGATGAPIRNRVEADADHRLRKLGPWLDYLIELGCNGLLLGPVFESVGHGYDTLDHYAIDARLGTGEDFDWLIQECTARGINVMLDGVFNHVARTHPAVQQGLAGDTDWEGHGELATLHHDEPQVREMVTDIMCHWLRRGIAGWRLDVAYSVPSDFWADVLARVREQFPDAMFLGEVIHGDYAGIATAGTMDSVTQYELWKAIWSSLHDANFFELDHALGRHREIAQRVLPNTFVGNHDVDRIASKIGQDKAIIATALLLTLPGMPSIYYGDEQGFVGLRTEGFEADDAVRPELPPTPEELSALGGWIFAEHQALIGVRRRHPWLTRASVDVVDLSNETISLRCFDDEHELYVDAWLTSPVGVRVHAGGETLYEFSGS